MEDKREFNLVRLWPAWFSFSGVLIVAGLVSMATRGVNWGIDFKGGTLFEYRLSKPAATTAEARQVTAKARKLLKDLGLQKSQIQLSDRDRLLIRTEAKDKSLVSEQDATIREHFKADFGEVTWEGTEMVGPVIGRELKRKALIGTLLGCALILCYVTIRYEFRFAVAGILALVHDVLMMVGFLSLLQIEVNSPFVAALLTVVGYSINDSVVIFDRIRENMKLRRRDPFDEVVNSSLLQTMSRSINTSVTVEFVLLTLLFFGGATVRDITIALIVGVTAGAYSSIFIAAPFVVVWRNASDRRRRVSVPSGRGTQRRRAAKPAVVTPEAPAVAAARRDATPVASVETSAPVSSPAATDALTAPKKKAKKSRKKRRRRH